MASIIKRPGGWQAQISRKIGDKTFREAQTFKRKREAQLWARETEAALEATASTGAASNDTLAQVFDRYARERSADKKGEQEELTRLERFKSDMANGRPLGEYLIGEIAAADLVAWRDSRLVAVKPGTGERVKPGTVRREMTLLKHVFKTAAEEWQLIPKNPMAGVKRPAGGPPRERRIEDHEIAAIRAALDLDREPWSTKKQITGAAFLFAIETGMRSGEILRIRNRDISGRVVHLPKTKNGKAREVPMTDRASEILAKVRCGNEAPDARLFDVDDGTRDVLFRKAVKKAGVEGLTFHDTRHEAVTRLSKDLNPLELARVIGHKDLKQLMTYYETSGEELAEKLNSSKRLISST